MSNLKVEGKVIDFCPNCKNCKSITKQYDGKNDFRIIEVECEDPYDGMVKTLDADSDICCSMFEAKPVRPCEKCERVDGTYCHGPNGTINISYKALFGESVNCPSFEERKEKEPFNLNMSREQLEEKILDLFDEKNRLNGIINKLEKEKANHLKGIGRLKKSNEKLQNQIKNLQITNEGSYKREEELEDKCHKLERRLLEEKKRFDRLNNEFILPLSRVLYPREAKICKPYSEVLNDIKDLKVQSNENGTMYEDLKYWKERCHKAETDVTTLNSKVEVLDKRNTNQFVMIGEKDKKIESLKNKIVNQQSTHYKQCARILELENMVSKLQSGEYDDILAKDIEVKSLQAKYEDAMAGWKDIIDTNDKLNQIISDLTESNENLKKAVERRDRWVDELRSDVDTLQNECLTIAEIAKRAYDDTNRD